MLEFAGAAQLRSTWCGFPVPLSPTVTVEFDDELLVMVNCPDAEPVAVGLNTRVMFRLWPGFSVAGRLTAEDEKPLPVTETALTMTAAVPLDVSVTVCVVELFTTTPPNEMLVALMLRAGVAAFSCSETFWDELPDVALTVAVCAVATEATFAVKDALLAVAGTVTALGTATELLLLASATVTPPVGAEPERLTLQVSERAPVIDVLLHDTALTVGAAAMPVPLRLSDVLGTLLEMVSCPVEEIALVGSN